MVDLAKPETRGVLAEQIRNAINKNSEEDNPPRYSWRLSPSSIGEECVAKLWLAYRWTKKVQKPGRISRLFKRGDGREDYFTSLLRRDGWEVRDYAQRLCYHPESDSYVCQDWDAPVEPPLDDVSEDTRHIAECKRRDKWLLQQYRLKQIAGHMTGYSDGRARHPVYTNNQWIGVEYKTYNTKRFSTLYNTKSVRTVDPKYYVQVVTYLREFDLPWGLFLAENKNDDDIYVEVILRDDNEALHYLKTAETVVHSQAMPARYAQSAAHHVCKFCDFVGVCHKGEALDRNCRSCQYARPAEEGKFHCGKWNAIIPGEKEMLAACPSYVPLVI